MEVAVFVLRLRRGRQRERINTHCTFEGMSQWEHFGEIADTKNVGDRYYDPM